MPMHQLAHDAGLAYAGAVPLTREEHAVAARYLRPPRSRWGQRRAVRVGQGVVGGGEGRPLAPRRVVRDRPPARRPHRAGRPAAAIGQAAAPRGRTGVAAAVRPPSTSKALRDADKVVDLVSGLTFAQDNCLDDAAGRARQPAAGGRRQRRALHRGATAPAALEASQVERWEEAIACEKATVLPGGARHRPQQHRGVRVRGQAGTPTGRDGRDNLRRTGRPPHQRAALRGGLPGQRDEVVTLRVENDAVERPPAAPPPAEPSSYASRFRRWW